MPKVNYKANNASKLTQITTQYLAPNQPISWSKLYVCAKGSIQKKNVYKALRLTAWVDPPLPRSGQENVKNSRQVVIFGVIFPFYKG